MRHFPRKTKKDKDREIAPMSLLLFYQWRVKGRTGHALRAYLKETQHQEPGEKCKTR